MTPISFLVTTINHPVKLEDLSEFHGPTPVELLAGKIGEFWEYSNAEVEVWNCVSESSNETCALKVYKSKTQRLDVTNLPKEYRFDLMKKLMEYEIPFELSYT